MNSLGERIKRLREEQGLRLIDIAEACGVKEATAQRWESGNIKNVKHEHILAIAALLHCDPSYLMGWTDDDINEKDDNIKTSVDNIYPLHTKRVPVLGAIACGKPIWVDEQHGEYIEVEDGIKADFALIAKGDSMIGARIYDGDVVFIRQQPQVENGEIAAVVIDDTATLKRFYIKDGYISLNAENPAYQPIILREGDADEIRILGKAVAFQSVIR